jgi:hypothetical protein
MTTTDPKVPAWFNLDALISESEKSEVGYIREELRAFVGQTFHMAERVRWATSLANRATGPIDGEVIPMFQRLAGLDELEDLASLIGYLFEPNSNITEDQVAKAAARWDETVPGLADAVTEASR